MKLKMMTKKTTASSQAWLKLKILGVALARRKKTGLSAVKLLLAERR